MKPKFPAWARIASLITGLLLLGDGMRRFALPQVERDLYTFMLYFLMGGACLMIWWKTGTKK